ncbi:MAG TPA: CAP domain-containing protein [Acidimicrobiales bacterium]|nr:CAP domain-containing protein [Acidimicrobiales bacterium]
MTKYVATVGFFLAACFAFVPAAEAADCGLLALLSPCTPVTQPAPAPLPLPLLDTTPTTVPVPDPAPAAVPVAAPVAVPVAQKMALPDAADRLLQLVNGERGRAGMPALSSSTTIAAIATGQSMAMAERGDIWHNTAYFTTATHRLLNAKALGENVAMNGSLDDAHSRLMASPGHRANILNAGFDTVGIAVVRDASGMLYITQDFADTNGQPAAAAAPAAAKAPAARPATGPAATRSAPAATAGTAAGGTGPAAPSFVAAAAPGSALAAGVDAAAGDSSAPPARYLSIGLFALALLAGVATAGTQLGTSALARR